MNKFDWLLETIINVTADIHHFPLLRKYSDKEKITAAFILDKPELIPKDCGIIEAWKWVDSWHEYIIDIKMNHMHKIK